jgi:hypothetical protein
MVFRDMAHYPYPGWLKSTWILIGDAYNLCFSICFLEISWNF